MEFRATVQRVNSLVESASRRFGSIAPLATRIVIGLAFFQAGLGKWRHMPNIVQFFDSLGIPLPAFNAYLVASMVLVGGLALILGLFTRFFAAGLTTTMVVALLTADTADFLASWSASSEIAPTDVTAFTFLLFLVWLVAYGAGKLSLDALLRRIFSMESEPLTGNSSTVAESV
ncbi:MAG: DoxX family protein [Deltaproteobacteria bacterium]|nr:DoxX family protein [Deltaproteobacteria bacterium]